MKDRNAQKREHLQKNGRFSSLKPRLLRCAGPKQARAFQDSESDRSEIEWTIALAATFAQVMREPFFSGGNWER